MKPRPSRSVKPDPLSPRSTRRTGNARSSEADPVRPGKRPTLRVFPTTLWEYPSQHYDSLGGSQIGGAGRDISTMQGDKDYAGATPSWVIWQLLQRYTREGDLVVDPMCGSGTTLDVARDLKRRALGYDLAPSSLSGRTDLFRADARALPLEDAKADFVFIDPPYSTHIDYSDDPACIGKLDALGADNGKAYFAAMADVLDEMHRVLKPRRYCALYVSDSFRKPKGAPASTGFAPIGFELFTLARSRFMPVDVISVVRHNQKLARGNWSQAAIEGNFFLRGFNYLMIFKKT